MTMTRIFAWLAGLFRSRRKLAELPPIERMACASMSRMTLGPRERGR